MRFENLCIGYRLGRGRTKVVASGLSATLMGGQLTCLLGRNGTGKSTLLRTLAGLSPALAPPDHGEGKRSRHVPPVFGSSSPKGREGWERLVAVVLTHQPDIRNMTVEEIVGLGRTPYTNFWGTLTEDDRQVVAEALRLVGIASLAHADFGMLSDGERQKVMVAKALAQQTPIIILDEPTAFLDYPSKRDVMALLRQLAHEQQKAILLSTHDVELAEDFADQIWFLHRDNHASGDTTNMGDSRLLTAAAHDVNIRELFA